VPTPFQVEILREVPQDMGSIGSGIGNQNFAPDSIPLSLPAEVATQAIKADAARSAHTVSASPQSDVLSTAPSRAPVQLDIPLDKYYTAREVDVRAEQLNEVDLIYPKRAYENRTKGRVLLRIYINDRGGIDNVVVVESAPAGIFEDAALTATLALHFKPAVKNQRNVKSIKTIEVVFDPYESINIP
jgi:TonB family protein